MALTKHPRKGDRLTYDSGFGQEKRYQIIDWMTADRAIAGIKNIDTGEMTSIIVRFADGEFNSLLTPVEA